MGQVPRLPLLPCLGESAPDDTLLFPFPPGGFGPCLTLGDYLIGSSRQSVMGVWAPLAAEGWGGFTIAFLGQTSKPPPQKAPGIQRQGSQGSRSNVHLLSVVLKCC